MGIQICAQEMENDLSQRERERERERGEGGRERERKRERERVLKLYTCLLLEDHWVNLDPIFFPSKNYQRSIYKHQYYCHQLILIRDTR